MLGMKDDAPMSIERIFGPDTLRHVAASDIWEPSVWDVANVHAKQWEQERSDAAALRESHDTLIAHHKAHHKDPRTKMDELSGQLDEAKDRIRLLEDERKEALHLLHWWMDRSMNTSSLTEGGVISQMDRRRATEIFLDIAELPESNPMSARLEEPTDDR
jgi:uncharacterized protein YPO0396